MTYFVPLAVSEAEAGESRDEIVADKLMVLSNERGEGGVPVFRSLRSFEAFVEAYGGDTEIAPWPTDPFRLAELLAVVDEPHRPEWWSFLPGRSLLRGGATRRRCRSGTFAASHRSCTPMLEPWCARRWRNSESSGRIR